MLGLLIIIGIIIVCWFCIKWWAGAAIKGGSAIGNAYSRTSDSKTVSYYTQFEAYLNAYNNVKKVEDAFRGKFDIICKDNGGRLPTYTKTELPDGNYRFDVTASNKAHATIRSLCCGHQSYSIFK